MMKKRLITILAGLLTAALSCYAESAQIRDIDIKVTVRDNGDIRIVEKWDITDDDHTEWYLVRENLHEIEIRDFTVSDNVGGSLTDVGRWNVDLSRKEKAGKFGIHPTSRGCELCWGLGEKGPHIFTASYTMTNACKSAEDADYLHIQFISDGLSSHPKHARVEIMLESREKIDTTFARAWGFGYKGTTTFTEEGSVVFESSETFVSSSSVIGLIRFDKGHIHPTCVRDQKFQEVLDKAMEGADFGDSSNDEDVDPVMVAAGLGIFTIIGLLIAAYKRIMRVRNMLGSKGKRDIQWYRDIPFEGFLPAAKVVLDTVREGGKGNQMASAMILQMIDRGVIEVRKNAKGKVDLALVNREDAIDMGGAYYTFWNMLYEASGGDHILQDKEFSKWAPSNASKISSWVNRISKDGKRYLAENKYAFAGKSTPSGCIEARNLLGLKKFLNEFTLVGEREVPEVTLWKDYLVFASLFGIADKVAEQLKDINPKAFEEVYGFDSSTAWQVIYLGDSLGRAITNAKTIYDTTSYSGGGGYSSSGGFGGGSSFGGGGGFSGGGHGGGGR